MCGLCGIVEAGRTDAPVSAELLARMRDTLVHRGPDDAGAHLGPQVALGSRRLSIQDLSPRGHMPMATPDGRYWIAYNGEVYNFRSLRADLEQRGVTFRSDSDTEVVLHSLVLDGPDAMNRFNGMFAYALWDAKEQSLLLGRDRLGIKPLYYAQDKGRLYFGSEEKAIIAAGFETGFDPHVWEELVLFRYVAGERTPYQGIRRLLPGHILKWKAGTFATHRWWNLSERARALEGQHLKDPIGWYRATFDDAVALRRISDVPVGVMLSGGLDSSAVAGALATQAGTGVESFTVRFPDQGYDEGPVAQSVVDRWSLKHHEIRLTPDELFEQMRRASWVFDEPLIHGNDTHMMALSVFAKPRVTVLLSGEGADETLNGYIRYQPLRWPLALEAGRMILPHVRAFERGKLELRARKLRKFLSMPSFDDFVLFNACDLLPGDLRELGFEPRDTFSYRRTVLGEAQRQYPRDYLRQAMYSDQHTFLCSLLDRNDRMTMGASIECRVPFLDYRLVEQVAAWPTSVLTPGFARKAILRRSMDDRLPEPVKRAPKKGFGVPWAKYAREVPAFRSLVESLPDREPIRSGPFDREKLRGTLRRYLNGESQFDPIMRVMLMTAVWHDVRFPPGQATRAAS